MVIGCVSVFVGLIWALISLSGAQTGVSRIFQELEYERQLGQDQTEMDQTI